MSTTSPFGVILGQRGTKSLVGCPLAHRLNGRAMMAWAYMRSPETRGDLRGSRHEHWLEMGKRRVGHQQALEARRANNLGKWHGACESEVQEEEEAQCWTDMWVRAASFSFNPRKTSDRWTYGFVLQNSKVVIKCYMMTRSLFCVITSYVNIIGANFVCLYD
jgi:hypothetical protein